MSIINRCESRDGKTVRLLAVHTTEGNTTATQLRDATWWTGSSHAINDAAGTLLTPAHGCVPYAMASWTLRSGNKISENIEQCGWARWTRAEWLARPKLLDTTALWLADRSRARGIPLVKLTAADIKAGKSGVIGHIDWTLTGDGSHTDPGPGYPWDVVLAKAKWLLNPTPLPTVQEDDMPYTPLELGNITSDAIANRVIASVGGKPYRAWEAWRDAGLKGVDAAKLAAEIVAKLPAPVVSASGGLTKTDVEAAVRAVFADAAS